MPRLSLDRSYAKEGRVKKKALFIGLFLALVLALSVSAVGATPHLLPPRAWSRSGPSRHSRRSLACVGNDVLDASP